MAPSYSRQFLIWTVPTIAILLSYIWYKRKRIDRKTDPGDRTSLRERLLLSSRNFKETNNPPSQTECSSSTSSSSSFSTSSSSSSSNRTIIENPNTPTRAPFSRSLSGVDSAPIDIIIPPKLKATKSNPVVISDEDLDLEIEKIKSMRYGGSIDLRKSNSSSGGETKRQPQQQQQQQSVSVKRSPKSVPPAIPTSVTDMAQKVVEEESASSVCLNNNNNNNNNSSGKEMTMMKQQPEEKSVSTDSVGNNNSNDVGQRQNSERDSANHSPADVMLASPSLSSISDNHSEGSNDSGKGGSDVVTPPPSRSLVTDEGGGGGGVVGVGGGGAASVSLYEFLLPQSLVGKLIGKHGSSVGNIKDKTGALVIVRKHPTNNKLKVCSIEGTQKEIDSALKLIRDKFPQKRFPEVTLEQVSFLPEVPTVSLVPDHLYLKLIEGINNDTIVSCIVAPNHLFLQQPTHPSFPNLNILNGYMNACYSEADSPLLPTPIPENTICAAFSGDSWYRAVILSTDQENSLCYVKFLDYGGYAYIENSKLRQIRGDFMLLPFQAAECFLANIKPIDESGWREETYGVVAQMTKSAIIYTQVVDYTEDGIPLVNCYLILGPRQVVFLNQELVKQGHAEWMSAVEEATGVTVA